MSYVVLADRRDEQKVIREEKEVWIYDVLVALGADEDILASVPERDMAEYLALLEIEVWHNADSTTDILRKGKLVAQWQRPNLILVKEGKNKYYYKIQINEWALPFQTQQRGE